MSILQGIEGFRSEVVKRIPQQELERASSEDLVQKQWERRDYLGIHPQKQESYSFVGLHSLRHCSKSLFLRTGFLQNPIFS